MLVDDGEHNGLFHRVKDAFALGEHALLDVRPNLEGLAAVAERHQNVLVIVLGVVVDALDDRMGALGEVRKLGLVQLFSAQVGLVGYVLGLAGGKGLGIHRGLDAKVREQGHAVAFEVFVWVRGQDMGLHEFVEHVGDVRPDAVAIKGVPSALVNDLALGVHHVVVLQQALADAKVVFLDLLLGALDALGDHPCLDDFPFLVAHAVHHLADALGAKQPHEVILQTDVELAGPWVPLTA